MRVLLWTGGLWRRGRGPQTPTAPRTHGPGPQSFVNPKLAHFSILKIFLQEGRKFRMDIKFARRNETLKGKHVCRKEL